MRARKDRFRGEAHIGRAALRILGAAVKAGQGIDRTNPKNAGYQHPEQGKIQNQPPGIRLTASRQSQPENGGKQQPEGAVQNPDIDLQ